jgi:hypothetical protein
MHHFPCAPVFRQVLVVRLISMYTLIGAEELSALLTPVSFVYNPCVCKIEEGYSVGVEAKLVPHSPWVIINEKAHANCD